MLCALELVGGIDVGLLAIREEGHCNLGDRGPSFAWETANTARHYSMLILWLDNRIPKMTPTYGLQGSSKQ
jgi:hypothetical protein